MVFIVDSSGSINEPNYEMARLFLKDVVNMLHVENDVTRIGVVQFSDDVREEFRMYSHGARFEIQIAIDQMKVLNQGIKGHQADFFCEPRMFIALNP